MMIVEILFDFFLSTISVTLYLTMTIITDKILNLFFL